MDDKPSTTAAPSTMESPQPKPTPTASVNKSRYKSPLSSLRNNYKPTVAGAAFKPIAFSSPVGASNAPTNEDVQPIPASRPREVPLTGLVLPDSVFNQSNTSLEGRGGDWRGPAQSDMRPEHRNTSRFRQDNFPRSPQTPQNIRDDNQSPYPMNTSTPIRNNSFGPNSRLGNNSFGNNSFGNNSFGNSSFQNNSFGNNSFGNDSFRNNSHGSQHGGYSPYNSSVGSQNSSNSGGNRKGYNNGGQRSFKAKEDMSLYYHKSMLEDPWAQLIEEKARAT